MKRTLLAAMISLPLLAAAAPAENETGERGITWGVRATLDVNFPGKWHFDGGHSVKMYNSKAGGHLGVVANIPVAAGFYIEPGASLFYDTYTFDVVMTDSEGFAQESNPLIQKFGFRIPVMAGYRFGLSDRASVSIFTGPELNYSAWGRMHVKNNYFNDAIPELFGEEGQQRRWNIAWVAGAALEWDSWVLSAAGSFGMNDLLKNDAKFHENRLSVSLGYNF